MKISGNDLFVTAMKKEGVDTIFAYPGGMVINLLDSLGKHKGIDLVLPRHEQGLIFAADGYARATGKVGVCLVTSGPGATNIVTGIANANYDSIPMVCFTGQVSEDLIGNDAFQEVDTIGVTRNIAKFVIMVRDRELLAQRIKEAFYIARSGKPGPVVVDLPTDVMAELGSTSYPTEISIRGYKPNETVHMGQLKKAIRMLKQAKKPMFLIGGGVNLAHAQEEMTQLAEKVDVPVITSVMGRGAIPTDHPLFIGDIGMHGSYAANRTANEADLIFAIGCRFGDRVTGKIETFAPHAKVVHIDIEAAAISRNVTVDIPITADAKKAIPKIIEHVAEMKHTEWIEEIKQWNKEVPLHVDAESGVNPQKIFDALNDIYHDTDTIYTSDVGQHQMWATQFLRLDGKHQLIQSGGLGTMGYGLPSAIGAKIGCQNKEIVSINGDGGFQMNLQEMAMGVCQETPMVVLIFNNRKLGMVRQQQKVLRNGHYVCTCLTQRKSCKHECETPGCQCPEYTPNFVKLAEAYGSKGYRIDNDDQIHDTIVEAREYANAHDVPVIVECTIDPDDMVTPMIKGGGSFEDIILNIK
ncbi:MAG: biosynthetic-type acetolactate synthase large subunit [Lachnospiraceae bacterium]|nr:biosynthetic-type acetolactate synthase large subunit [Lachnospiraceae bacterium]